MYRLNVGLTASVQQLACGLGKVYLRSGQDVLALNVGWNNDDILTERFVGTQRITLPFPVPAGYSPVFYGIQNRTLILIPSPQGVVRVVSIDPKGPSILVKDAPDKFAVIVNGVNKQQLRVEYTVDRTLNSDDVFEWVKSEQKTRQPDWKSTGIRTLPDLKGHIWRVDVTGEQASRVKVNNLFAAPETVTFAGLDLINLSILGLDCC